VPFVQYAMNAKVATIHNSTPFAALFGRNPNQFVDFSLATESPATADDVTARIQLLQEAVFPGIADRARSTQNAMKVSYDATHTQINIPEGSYVMLRDNTRRRKLDPRYEGPFKVRRKTGKTYTLEDNSGALLPRNYAPSALKLISADPVFLSESFQVDTILNHRATTDGKYDYLVRWKNHSEEHDSWEPASNFDDEATIINYWNRRGPHSSQTPTTGGDTVMRAHVIKTHQEPSRHPSVPRLSK
jgi:Chromo (CHRromatin Organisation MOdifier) domain